MSDKPTILFLSIVRPGYSPYLAAAYGLQRSFDLMPHKLAVMALTAWLRERGMEGHYVWAESSSDDDIQVFYDAIEKYRPDALGFSLVTEEMMLHKPVIERLRKDFPDIPTIIGGPHVTYSAQHTVEKFPIFDYVAIGEGEVTLEQWLKAIHEGQPKSVIAEIPGLAFIGDNGEYVQTSPRTNIPEIDILPEPAYDLVYSEETTPDQRTAFPMVCSYGCYFHCTFCSVPHGRYRGFSPKRVVDRIEQTQKAYGVEYFAIRDSFWPPTRKWLDDFLDELEERKLKVKFHFQTRAGTCTEEQLVRLKKNGAQAVAIGVEAGNPAVLKAIKKGITVNMARKTLAFLNKVGIFSIGFFILGNKDETAETIQETLDFAIELNPSISFFHVLYPLPGAEAFDSVPEEEKDWWMGGPVPSICELPFDELGKLGVDAFLRYPLRWDYFRQHILAGKLSPEFRAVARKIYFSHLKKYILGMLERITPARVAIRGLKKAIGRQ